MPDIDTIATRLEQITLQLSKLLGAQVKTKSAWESLDDVVNKITDPLRQYTLTISALDSALSEVTDSQGRFLEGLERQGAALKREIAYQNLARSWQDAKLRFWNDDLRMQKLATAALAKTYKIYTDISQNLIEANSAFAYRNKLLKDTLEVTGRTGVSFEKSTASAKALVGYGLDNNKSWSENVRVVTQLAEGLGASVEQAAQLAAIVENRLNQSFSKLSDTVASIVNDTALSADQTQEIAAKLGRTIGSLGPEFKANIDEITRAVARYESANKELGGSSGEITDFITKLASTVEGITGLQTLGVDANFFKSAEGIDRLMHSFQRFSAQFDRMDPSARMQQLSATGEAVFGKGIDDMTRYAQAVQRANVIQPERIQLEKRFQEQMAATNRGVERLKNELWFLVVRALEPAVALFSKLTNLIADLLGKINESPVVATILQWTTAAIGLAAAARGVIALFRPITSLFSVLARFGPALARVVAMIGFGAGGTATAATGGAVAAGGAIASIGLGPILIVLGIIAAVLTTLYKLYQAREDQKRQLELQKEVKLTQDRLAEKQQSIIRQAYASGNYGQFLDALFGHENTATGRRRGGYVQHLMEKDSLTAQQAVDKALAEFEPVRAQLRSVAATLTSATEKGPSAASAALEGEFESLNERIRMEVKNLERSREKISTDQLNEIRNATQLMILDSKLNRHNAPPSILSAPLPLPLLQNP